MSAAGNQLVSTAGFPSSWSSKREKSQIKRGVCFAAGKHSGAPMVWGQEAGLLWVFMESFLEGVNLSLSPVGRIETGPDARGLSGLGRTMVSGWSRWERKQAGRPGQERSCRCLQLPKRGSLVAMLVGFYCSPDAIWNYLGSLSEVLSRQGWPLSILH